MPEERFDALVTSLKKLAAALHGEGIPFALGGGFAIWARGGSPPGHDVDFMVKREDVERAALAAERAGMRVENPPEDWLIKAWDGEVMLDLIFEPAGLPITDEVLERADEWPVEAMSMRVMAAGDVLASLLLACNEKHLDFEGLLAAARAVREQVDWDDVRRRVEHSPFARAWFCLAEDLGIVERAGETAER